MVSRKYNQRTKEWNSKVVKANKGYEYIPVPILIAKILRLRNELATMWSEMFLSLNENDPAVVAPTIAEKPPPSSKELFQSRKTMFKSNKTVETSDNLTTNSV